MKRNLINFRLPEDLIEAIKIRAEEQDISKTELIEALIRQGLGLPVNQFGFTNSFTANQGGFTDVNQDVKPLINQLVNQAVAEAVNEAIATLEIKLDLLESRVDSMLQKPEQVTEAIAPKERVAIAPNANEGISQTQLCHTFGIDPSNVAKRAKKLGLTSEEFLSRETRWFKQGRLWYQS